MSLAARNSVADSPRTITDFEILSGVRSVIRLESEGLEKFNSCIPLEFVVAIRLIEACKGSVIVAGIGKAGWIGQKISASFASTGTRSHFLHAAEAFHGDLGRVSEDDVVLILSNSGETEEVIKMLSPLRKSGAKLIAVTGMKKARSDRIAIAPFPMAKLPKHVKTTWLLRCRQL